MGQSRYSQILALRCGSDDLRPGTRAQNRLTKNEADWSPAPGVSKSKLDSLHPGQEENWLASHRVWRRGVFFLVKEVWTERHSVL